MNKNRKVYTASVVGLLRVTVLLFSAFAHSHEPPSFEMPHIAVYGTAVTEVVPDTMIWQLSVKTKDRDIESVARQHAARVSAVLAFLKQKKIKDKKVQTNRMNLSENWQYRSNSRVKEGYIASTSISFESADLSTYQAFWSGLSKLKGVSINGTQFDISERINVQNETRGKALLAAKEKAQAMAKSLSTEISEPLLIEEMGTQDDVRRENNAIMEMSSRQSTQGMIAPGQLEVRLRVRVVFRLN